MRTSRLLLGLIGIALALSGCAAQGDTMPSVQVQVGQGQGDNLTLGVQLLLMLTVLSVVPGILIMVSSFVRVA
ncbi:MAG: hypothetical protein QOF51_2769, partial [Chloroflexota bacterium]|nr:hypothetical protein [Chloroflexota bacterium]